MYKKIFLSFQLLLLLCVHLVCFSQTVAQQQVAMDNKRLELISGILNGTTIADIPFLDKYDYKMNGATTTNMLTDGSWSDLLKGSNYDKKQHVERLRRIAELYRSKTVANSSLVAEMVQTLRKGITFMYKNGCKTCKYSTKDNEYQLYCETPNYYADLILLLKNEADFPNDSIKKYSQMFLKDEILYVQTTRTTLRDASNYIDHCTSVYKKGILENDFTLYKKGLVSMIDAIKFSDNDTEVSGIRVDYSFHAHGKLMYHGGYGKSFIGGLIPIMSEIQKIIPNQKDVTRKEILFMDSLILDGFMQLSYRGAPDFGVLGRYVSRKVGSRQPVYYSTFTTLINVNKHAGLDTARLVTYRRHNDIYQSTKTAFPEIGNKHFWNGDMMVQHGANYYLSAKIVSARTVGFETQNGENIFGYNIPLGATNIMNHGNEYKEIYPLWDWSRIPGTTAELGFVPPISVDRYIGKNKFGGGVSSGTSGVMAFVMQDTTYTTFYRGVGETAPLYNRIKARKAYFFMNDAMLCLGSGITANKNNPIITSINQCFTNGTINVGEANSTSVITKKTFTNTLKWVHHDNVGYIFPNTSAKITVCDSLHKESWDDINSIPVDPNVISDQLFSLYFDHGKKPSNATYEYIVLPNTSLTDCKAKASNNAGFKIIQNDATAQAVLNTITGEYAVVFYEPASIDMLDGFNIRSDKPAIVLIKKNTAGYQVSISDPLYQPGNVIKVNLNKLLTGPNAISYTYTTTITATMPTGNYLGSTVTNQYNTKIVTGVDEDESLNGFSIKCYPNPFNNTLHLQTIGAYTLYDLSGVKIESGTCEGSCEIGNSLNSDIYILEVGSQRLKIVKQ